MPEVPYDIESWYRSFSQQVAAPALAGSMQSQKELYGRLRRAHKVLVHGLVPDTGSYHNNNAASVKALATVSGLLVMSLVCVKRDCRAVREIVPLLPLSLHQMLFSDLPDNIVRLASLLDRLMEVVWTDFEGQDQGLAYVGLHCRGQPRWFYPGFTHRTIQRGRLLGRARYPVRVIEHQLGVRSATSRDGALPRNLRFREWGDGEYAIFPAFWGPVRSAYNREQHIIRAKRPLSVAISAPPRTPPPRTLPRRRPLPSQRRREQRQDLGRIHRQPQMQQNYNLASYTIKEHPHLTAGGPG